ncbi:MAG: hypothetical protein OEY59_08975 [Deltaproteobacteria bacterium]|nr:hypothetical protein [Deltaproteobacteria bacterium]
MEAQVGSQESGQKQTITPSRISTQQLPPDFVLRLATKITIINEREMDEHIATGKVASIIYQNLNDPEKYSIFLEVVELLLEKEETQKIAATTWVSLLWHDEEFPEYKVFVDDMLDRIIDGHRSADRPQHEEEVSKKQFSAYAYSLGEVFIQMMKLNSDLYEVLTEIFTYLIRTEMNLDLYKKQDEHKRKKISGRKKQEEKKVTNTKKLYDDIVDYISQRGDFRSDTLNQKNPNEFIMVLADRMRSTRRYVIQDIMNRYALDKKKQLEKELRAREAGAEEVITCSMPFSHGLYLYWVEKRYNFKYLAVEKVRITLQVIGFFMGIFSVGVAYLNLADISLLESLLVGVLMFVFSKLVCSRHFFVPFYPKDVTTELEQDVSAFTPVFRKMSLPQMNSFLNKQLKIPDNVMLMHLMPEYIKYIFAVMPERNNILLTKEDIGEFMEKLEVNIGRIQRGMR